MRIATWNVNSIRSRSRRLYTFLDLHQPDVLAIQETKCSDRHFAEAMTGPLHERGYRFAHHGVDHWNGVGIISRVGLDEVQRGFAGPVRPPFDEARLLRARCGGVEVWSIYVPNGRALDSPHYLTKLVWLERLRGDVADSVRAGSDVMLLGDFNVAPTDADVYDPVRWRRRTHASPPERAAIEALGDLGLVDVTRVGHPGPGVFTWWNYRPGQFDKNRGLRIDLALASQQLADRVDTVLIDRTERVDDQPDEKPSDHAPLIVDLADAVG